MPNPLRHPRNGPNNVVWHASYYYWMDARTVARNCKDNHPSYRYRIRYDKPYREWVLIVWDSNL